MGAHDVAVRIEDGLGGAARLRVTLTVTDGDANSPPLFTTAPPTHSAVGAAYVYEAGATELDDDALTWSLAEGPGDMSLDGNGRLTWAFALPGQHDVTIEVSDGAKVAQHQFTLSVGAVPANPSGPLITSSPPTEAAVDRYYEYLPVAHDPDDDLLLWYLDDGPPGMVLDDGLLTWTPDDIDGTALGAAHLRLQRTTGRQRRSPAAPPQRELPHPHSAVDHAGPW